MYAAALFVVMPHQTNHYGSNSRRVEHEHKRKAKICSRKSVCLEVISVGAIGQSGNGSQQYWHLQNRRKVEPGSAGTSGDPNPKYLTVVATATIHHLIARWFCFLLWCEAHLKTAVSQSDTTTVFWNQSMCTLGFHWPKSIDLSFFSAAIEIRLWQRFWLVTGIKSFSIYIRGVVGASCW